MLSTSKPSLADHRESDANYLNIHKESENISRLKATLGKAQRINSNFKKDSVAMDNKTNFTQNIGTVDETLSKNKKDEMSQMHRDISASSIMEDESYDNEKDGTKSKYSIN